MITEQDICCISDEITQFSISNYNIGYREPLTCTDICQVIATDYNISLEVIFSRNRQIQIVYARFLAMFFCFKYVTKNKKMTGRIFNKDHSCVINAINKLENEIEYNKELKRRYDYYDKLFAKLKNQ